MKFGSLAVILAAALHFVAINSAPIEPLGDARLENEYPYAADPENSDSDLVVEEPHDQLIIFQSYSEGSESDPLDGLDLEEFPLNFVSEDGPMESPELVMYESKIENESRLKFISINLIRIFLVLGLVAFLISFVSVLSCCVFCLLFKPNGNVGSTYFCYEELPRGDNHREFVYNYNYHYDEALLQNFIQPHDLPPKYRDLNHNHMNPIAIEAPPSYSPSMGVRVVAVPMEQVRDQ